jgi:hypothetical protein
MGFLVSVFGDLGQGGMMSRRKWKQREKALPCKRFLSECFWRLGSRWDDVKEKVEAKREGFAM